MISLKTLWESISGARNAIVTGLAVAGLCLPLGYCTGFKSASATYSKNLAEANRTITVKDAALKEAAARERLRDQIVTDKQEKELLDAVEKLPDALPSARRLARACVQLRQAGTREPDLPLVCRSGGGDGAQARPAARDRDQ
jgi:hypothetical protein